MIFRRSRRREYQVSSEPRRKRWSVWSKATLACVCCVGTGKRTPNSPHPYNIPHKYPEGEKRQIKKCGKKRQSPAKNSSFFKNQHNVGLRSTLMRLRKSRGGNNITNVTVFKKPLADVSNVRWDEETGQTDSRVIRRPQYLDMSKTERSMSSPSSIESIRLESATSAVTFFDGLTGRVSEGLGTSGFTRIGSPIARSAERGNQDGSDRIFEHEDPVSSSRVKNNSLIISHVEQRHSDIIKPSGHDAHRSQERSQKVSREATAMRGGQTGNRTALPPIRGSYRPAKDYGIFQAKRPTRLEPFADGKSPVIKGDDHKSPCVRGVKGVERMQMDNSSKISELTGAGDSKPAVSSPSEDTNKPVGNAMKRSPPILTDLVKLERLFPRCPVISEDDLDPVRHTKKGTPIILGKGVFGKVHLMRQRSTGRLCAVKVFKEDINSWQIFVAVKTEVDMLTKLSGLDCVPQLYGITPNSANGGVPSVVQEFIGDGTTFETTTLYKAFKGRGRPSKEWTSRVIIDIVCALQKIHSNGVYHCDLKIDNIMLAPGSLTSDNPKVMIIDFGQSLGTGKPIFEHFTVRRLKQALLFSIHLDPAVAKGERPYDEYSEMYALGRVLQCVAKGAFMKNLAKSCLKKAILERPNLESLLSTVTSYHANKYRC